MSVQPVQLTAGDGATSRGLFFRAERGAAHVGVHLMHPRADSSGSYVIRPLVAAGCAVLARSSRSPNNDTMVVQEQLLLDVAAGVTFLRESGCHHVILLGLSSGAPLAAFYQAEARAAAGMRLRETPAGDVLDLNTFSMPPADAIISLCGHGGLGWVMSKLIDPAVIDERDPLACDPDLDLYDPRNGFRIPPESSRYTPAFLERYRAAQRERVKRIDQQARRLLAIGEVARAAVHFRADRQAGRNPCRALLGSVRSGGSVDPRTISHLIPNTREGRLDRSPVRAVFRPPLQRSF